MMDEARQSGDELFLFVVHVKTERISRLYREIVTYFEGRGRVVPIRYVEDKSSSADLEIEGDDVVTVDREDLASLGYPVKCAPDAFRFIPGNTDLIDMYAYRTFGTPSYLWRMECDVAYTGDIHDLFDVISREDADLVCTRTRVPKSGWQHHKRCRIPESWPAYETDDPIVFLPFARASARLMAALDEFYRLGGHGHSEWTWAYVPQARNLRILDIGGAGPYTPPNYRNLYYPAPSAFRRPAFDPRYVKFEPGASPDTLWHPVKDWKSREKLPLSETALGHFFRHLVHENLPLRRLLLKLRLVR
jgi:hypothetical protein